MADIMTVEAVEGRAIDHPQTGLRIKGTKTVPNTREIRRAVAAGDLKQTKRPKDEPLAKPAPKKEADKNG